MGTNEPSLNERLEYIRQRVQSVQGWIYDQAGFVLYQLAKAYTPNPPCP